MKLPLPLRKYRKIIESIDHDDDGYWVYLHYGNCAGDTGLHTIHEDSWKECAEKFWEVRECDCRQCKNANSV